MGLEPGPGQKGGQVAEDIGLVVDEEDVGLVWYLRSPFDIK